MFKLASLLSSLSPLIHSLLYIQNDFSKHRSEHVMYLVGRSSELHLTLHTAHEALNHRLAILPLLTSHHRSISPCASFSISL